MSNARSAAVYSAGACKTEIARQNRNGRHHRRRTNIEFSNVLINLECLLLAYFVSPAVEKIESLDHLVGRLVTAIRKISLNNGTLPFGMTVGPEIIG
jgi:hypothetical protein